MNACSPSILTLLKSIQQECQHTSCWCCFYPALCRYHKSGICSPWEYRTYTVTGVDFDRTLTPHGGEEQAHASGSSFGVHLLPFYPIALCSPAPHCVSTFNILSSIYHSILALDTTATLYDGTMQPERSYVFKKHGYTSLRTYIEDSDAEDLVVAKKICGMFANNAMDEILYVGS